MKNIHVLPTDKPSRFYSIAGYYTKSEGFAFGEHYIPNTRNMFKNCNIYITTADEEIKYREWMYVEGVDAMSYGIARRSRHMQPEHFGNCKKIILTTDPELIKEGVQAIDDNFLEWFIKNRNCECVEIKKDNHLFCKHCNTLHSTYGDGVNCDVCRRESNPYSKTLGYKIIIPKEEAKQETLEETAERYAEGKSSSSVFQEAHITDFMAGAKWQQERSYSEEEVLTIFLNYRNHFELYRNIQVLPNYFFEWFKQYKKNNK